MPVPLTNMTVTFSNKTGTQSTNPVRVHVYDASWNPLDIRPVDLKYQWRVAYPIDLTYPDGTHISGGDSILIPPDNLHGPRLPGGRAALGPPRGYYGILASMYADFGEPL